MSESKQIYTWEGGGKTRRVYADGTPVDAPPWRVTWGLEIFQDSPEGKPVFDSPDVNCFRLTFATREEAATFKAELQRYLGDLYIRNLEAKEDIARILRRSGGVSA